MSERGPASLVGVYARLVGALSLIATAVAAGLWMGDNWDGLSALWESDVPRGAMQQAADTVRIEPMRVAEAAPPPLYFMAAPPPGADLTVFLQEVVLAAGAGVHRVIVSVSLPWPGQGVDTGPAVERLRRLFAANPQAVALLRIDLNPPAAWLEEHASATVTVGGERLPYPCVASAAWLQDAKAALSTLAAALLEAFPRGRIEGCLLTALEQGQWYRTGGYDRCQDNATGFRQWLRLRYANDEELQAAWNDHAVTLDSAPVPEDRDPSDQVFLALPDMQRHVDFLQYTSEAGAQAIGTLATHVKEATGPEAVVAAPYGFHFELPDNGSGHLALSRLLASDLDCLVSPISYADRGLGGAGGVMGPVDSAIARGKRWILIDDTRTGAAMAAADAPSDAAPSQDVYQVQRRNFVTALTHGTGLAWADPDGLGWLQSPETWDRIAGLRQAYAAVQRNDASATEAAGGVRDLYDRTTLLVVVDEQSRFFEQDNPRVGALLKQCRSAALRAGVPVRFCLLQDVLRGAVPPAAVYWFLNPFRLTVEQRGRLHEILARDQAAAIWMYAPGYVETGLSVEGISATVRMQVKAFPKPAPAGSAFDLAGRWAAKGEAFGETAPWDPLFHIDDPNASVLARYRDSDKPSAALVYCEEGWKSIYVAEPAMTPAVLREILQLLEQHLYLRRTAPVAFDATYVSPRLLAVHAGDAGERAIDLGQVFDIGDLFDPQVGWPRTRLINLRLYAGETRVLRVSPPK